MSGHCQGSGSSSSAHCCQCQAQHLELQCSASEVREVCWSCHPRGCVLLLSFVTWPAPACVTSQSAPVAAAVAATVLDECVLLVDIANCRCLCESLGCCQCSRIYCSLMCTGMCVAAGAAAADACWCWRCRATVIELLLCREYNMWCSGV